MQDSTTVKHFPKGVDKLTALMDMLAGWQSYVSDLLLLTDDELKEMNTTRSEWEKHHQADYFDIIFDLYQDSAQLTELPDNEQVKAVERFLVERVLPLFKP